MGIGDSKNGRFVELFNQNKNNVYDYVCRMTGDHDTAADITQESFIRLYNNIAKNRAEIKSPRNWLFIIARNLFLNNIRDTKNEIPIDQASHSKELQYSNINPTHIKLDQAMNHLEAEHKEALILKEYQGFSYNEISEIMRISVPAVRALLFKARIALRENFKKITAGR